MKVFVFIIALLLNASAFADTYAHVETGQVLDPQENASASLYLKRFNSAITGKWQVERVPPGAHHNAAYSGSTTPGSAQYMDSSKYLNPDWTDGAGKPVPKPENP